MSAVWEPVSTQDGLSRLSESTWAHIGKVERLVRECDLGRALPLDYMEREIPRLVFNSRGYLAVFNSDDRPQRIQVRFVRYLEGLVHPDARFTDVWSGEHGSAVEGVLDAGVLAPHASRLLRLEAP